MTSGSDFLRKMSLLRRKVRRRDVTRYMSPHLCSSCVLEYPACEFNVGQSTDKFIQTVPLQFTITTLTANRLARVSQFFHCSSLFICGRGEAPGSSREALPPSAPPPWRRPCFQRFQKRVVGSVEYKREMFPRVVLFRTY